MENRGFLFKVQDIINKMKKLCQKYKTDKDKTTKSGTARKKPWTFFQKMDEILAHRPTTRAPTCLDSSAIIEQEEEAHSGSESDKEAIDNGMLFTTNFVVNIVGWKPSLP